jgi:hypothetical protein
MVGIRVQHARRSAIALERAVIVAGILAFSQITWQILATAQWRGFLEVFRVELSRNSGFIAFENSPMVQQPAGIQVVRNLAWDWTTPSMSIVLSPGGHVSTIFGARPGRWQPFDPLNARELPNLSRYGIDYSTYVSALGERRPRSNHRSAAGP